ncbi:uncharacterized protein Z518_01114 [Rhinocladiella mackenziei CBS 650.93]|uniref:Rhinocladiella mackenziei CBS 650.93 unplaced genomic scaffold supercont1.1, whole genome shotgun sequence n=1 Tax=Rhinocladiella mackenziei CBS 650.93 TaxID=1442369 RepID=A0A0D2HHD4_9EURO|nr:uncharacterized protein Z518_01114 [Rhinocladiella mackenziei CBS 650.93]KIX10033.1 hypothetical protein Z518_01114 [Rhinocladiella mackenziei CBS 650.93]
MIPLAALIILIVVVTVSSLTFLIAIYSSVSSCLESPKIKATAQEKEMTLPLTETVALPATISTSSLLPLPVLIPPVCSEAPEAEFPPPLPDELVDDDDVVEAESPPPLPRPDRDSMHEILDLYTNEARNLPPGPKSAPARFVTFDQAESK